MLFSMVLIGKGTIRGRSEILGFLRLVLRAPGIACFFLLGSGGAGLHG